MSAFNYNLTKPANNKMCQNEELLNFINFINFINLFCYFLIYLTSFPARQIRSRL